MSAHSCEGQSGELVQIVSSRISLCLPPPWTVWWNPQAYAWASLLCGNWWWGMKCHSPDTISTKSQNLDCCTNLYWLSAEDEKRFCSLGEEPCEFVHKYMLNLIRLLNLDANTHTINAGLYQNSFVFVSRDGKRIQEDFRRCLSLDFRHIVSFWCLRCEVWETQCRS